MGKDVVLRPPAYAVVPPAAMTAPPWGQQPAMQSEALPKAFARWVRRNSHVTVPLAAPVILWLSALVLYIARPAPYLVPLCGALLSGCVWFFAPHKWDRKAEQWYARLSVILAALWLSFAAWAGPAPGEAGAIAFAAVLAAGCGAWGYFWFQHKRPRGQRRRARLIAQCDDWWQRHCQRWNLYGSHVIDAKLSGVTLSMRIQGIAGTHSYQSFEQQLHLIESAAEGHADVGLVRIARVPKHPSQVDLFLKQENPLREPVTHDPGIAPRSVHQDMAIGRSETGAWKMIPVRSSAFVIGMIRSGKSNHLLVRLAALSGCSDGRGILVDLKGGRSARPVLQSGCAEHVVTEVDEARLTLRFLDAEIKARAKLAYTGDEQLLADDDTPSLHLFIDETHGLTSIANGDAECAAKLALVASQGPGLEVYAEVYTQFGSLEESVRTDQTRGNLPVRACYRVEEARHGSYVIPEYARLDASKLEEKGTCYLKDGPRVFPEQVRAPHMPHSLFFRIAAQNAALMGARPPLRLYCGPQVAYRADGRDFTWQEWWDTRWLRLDPAFHSDSPQYQAATAESPHEAAEVVARAQQAAEPVPSPAPGAGDARAAAARLAADDAGLMDRIPADFRPDPELVRRLPRQIASEEDRFAEALQAAASDSPATPGDLAAESGRSRSWVHGQITALLEIGHITQVSYGQYAPVPGMDIRQGMDEIKARNARLAREARQKVDAA